MDYDVVIVGGSLAGCAAATHYGRAGLRVAVVEKQPDARAYKTTCNHFILASAVPALERLGLTRNIEEAGGVPNSIAVWSSYGWIHAAPPADYPYPVTGYNITRRRLDPMVRELAGSTDGVDLMLGHTATALEWDRGRVAGVRVRDRGGAERTISGRLIVAADGRYSKLARMAGIRTRTRPHERFYYWAYFRGVELDTPASSQMWFLNPDMAYTFGNEDGLTVLTVLPGKHRLPEFKADLEGAFMRSFEGLPRGPRLDGAERVSKIMGKLDLTNVRRRPAAKGMALIGDAALASDPLWGIGCGWAFQSAEWLVDATAEALRRGTELAPGLRRYQRTHRRRLAGHDFMICDYSRLRGFNPIERLVFSAAVHDPGTALHFHAFGTRSIGVSRFLAPAPLARAARALATRRRGATTRPADPPGAARAPRRPAPDGAAPRG
jgi:2-polyprenyl-6-methoxyphenol hydroxylase-like FAD-dependent oxidoreductase